MTTGILSTCRWTGDASRNERSSPPRQSIGPIDELMCKQVGTFYDEWKDAKRKVDERPQGGPFSRQRRDGRLRRLYRRDAAEILDHVARVRPMIIELIADVQRKAS